MGIELLINSTKSHVFTVLPTANQMNWSQMELSRSNSQCSVLAKGCCKTPILQIRWVDQKFPGKRWLDGCVELPALKPRPTLPQLRLSAAWNSIRFALDRSHLWSSTVRGRRAILVHQAKETQGHRS